MMLVTPASSVRTVRPATAVANHKKVLTREKAKRKGRMASHHEFHNDGGRIGCMIASMINSMVAYVWLTS
jgi:hypothetical protein